MKLQRWYFHFLFHCVAAFIGASCLVGSSEATSLRSGTVSVESKSDLPPHLWDEAILESEEKLQLQSPSDSFGGWPAFTGSDHPILSPLLAILQPLGPIEPKDLQGQYPAKYILFGCLLIPS